jgi:activating signal cointegrator complex subunit 3
MRYIAWHSEQNIRFVGLSATISNAKDVADWLGIEKKGLYNFRQSVRPGIFNFKKKKKKFL